MILSNLTERRMCFYRYVYTYTLIVFMLLYSNWNIIGMIKICELDDDLKRI